MLGVLSNYLDRGILTLSVVNGSSSITASVFAGGDERLRAIKLWRCHTLAWTPLLNGDTVADTIPTLCRCEADFNVVPAGERGIMRKKRQVKRKIKLQYEAVL